LLEEEVVYI